MTLDRRYVRLAVTSGTTSAGLVDELTVRKAVQDALAQTFGTSYANAYVDILWVGELKHRGETVQHAVFRASADTCNKVTAAIASIKSPPYLSLVKESQFLPALLAWTDDRECMTST